MRRRLEEKVSKSDGKINMVGVNLEVTNKVEWKYEKGGVLAKCHAGYERKGTIRFEENKGKTRLKLKSLSLNFNTCT
jgi:hypothetical protein